MSKDTPGAQAAKTDNSRSRGNIVPVQEGADALIELFNSNGVKYIFFNPGSDLFPVLEAIARYRSEGKPAPELVLCPHESVAMSAAHGYYVSTGHPQVVMVHADVGPQQIGGAMHNAQRGRIGVVICTGYPSGIFKDEQRGGRDNYPQWYQEQLDPAATLRNYVKWYYQLQMNENIHVVVNRAFQVAATEPAGPVFLGLPRELLMEQIDRVVIPPPGDFTVAESAQPDPESLRQAARWLIEAKHPLGVTGYSGRNHSSVAPLVQLAEFLGMRVINSGTYMNFPTEHPSCGERSDMDSLGKADVLLVIDHDIPYIPTSVRPSKDARIIYIDIDPIKATMPLWHFPASMRLQGDSAKAIPSLMQLVSVMVKAEDKARFQQRFAELKTEKERRKSRYEQAALEKSRGNSISSEWLCYCINRELKEEDIVLAETTSNSAVLQRYLQRSKPGTFFRSGGTNLGWGMGAPIGLKLAQPDKLVVTAVGDGAFIYGCPTAALWTSRNRQAPFLAVIFNNGAYNAIRKEAMGLYGTDSNLGKSGSMEGLSLKPSPEYTLIAQACGAKGIKATRPEDLPGIIKKAVELVRGGETVVLDVLIG
ncbi:MAG: thiamine pyrophosphate-requiring protein [Dehalococcoidia bacterium]|nr:thiamine pyrophosphate-requiring protein [Dehalococcoidia bacterium]MDZ4246470.1 thiamine pyrophosphate-requiring protein [Dehalococcoidia bacterium]